MIVDSSAIIAMIKMEPEVQRFAQIMSASPAVKMSAATYLESWIVVDGARQPVLVRQFEDLLSDFQVRIEPVTVGQAQVAREAYRDYGKGSGHPARLNFGDCFTYALARVTGEPLLYKGDDFLHTDLKSAIPLPD